MPFAIKQNKRLKFTGVPPTYTHTHTHLGEALSSMIQNKKIKENKKKKKKR